MGNHFCDFSLSDAVIQRAPYVMTDLAGRVQCGAYCDCNHAAITGRKFFSLPGFGINNLIQQISQVGGLRESSRKFEVRIFRWAPVGGAGW